MARIMMIANSSWNLQHFRRPVLAGLLEAGHEIATVTPDAAGVIVGGRRLGHRQWNVHRSSTNPAGELGSLARLVRIVREERPDAILSFTVKPNVYGCLAARVNKVPAIPNVSGLGSSFIGRRAIRLAVQRMYRIAFARSPKVFFQNGEDAALFVSTRTVTAPQAEVLPGSGVDLDHFAPAPLPQKTRFLMIARLLRDKGVREYVEAAGLVRASVPDASFALVGDLDRDNPSGVAPAELDGWIADGVIDYLGPVADVRPAIREASAVVLPSYREGLPRSLLEGAAMARPLIATDVPGCRELVRPDVTGVLCRVRDAQDLAAAMERMALMPHADRAMMGRRAREMVEREFDQGLVVQAYLDAVAEAVRG